MKRLAVFLDGTWNDKGSRTNVHRLSELVAPRGTDGIAQELRYDPGVGTKWHNKLSGGTLGRGLSDNVRQAYSWLLKRYEDGDHVFIFGFSRGAYTARSLGGLIAGCGLRRNGAPFDVDYLYDRYQKRKDDAVPIYKLQFIKDSGERKLTDEESRLLEFSRRIDIHMMGVWDTVGALGVPWTGMPVIGRDQFYFHNPNLSKIYKHAYQALAVDEHRGAYKPTLWTLFKPEIAGKPAEPPAAPEMPPLNDVEQRWFIGAHSNVGGGYENDQLSNLPLIWMQTKAEVLGLRFTQTIGPTGKEFETAPVDSYGKFLFHAYQVLTLGRRYYRPIGAKVKKVKKGWSYPVNETIDSSVFRRFQAVEKYRPKNLEEWAKRKGVNLTSISGDGEA